MSANKSRALEEAMSTPQHLGDAVQFEYYLKSSSQLPPLKTNERAKGSPSGRNLPLLQGKRHLLSRAREFCDITIAPISPLNQAWRIFRPPHNDTPIQRSVRGQTQHHLGDFLGQQQL